MKNLQLKTGNIKIRKRKNTFFLIGTLTVYDVYSIAFDKLENDLYRFNFQKTNQDILNEYVSFTGIEIEQKSNPIYNKLELQNVIHMLNHLENDLKNYIQEKK